MTLRGSRWVVKAVELFRSGRLVTTVESGVLTTDIIVVGVSSTRPAAVDGAVDTGTDAPRVIRLVMTPRKDVSILSIPRLDTGNPAVAVTAVAGTRNDDGPEVRGFALVASSTVVSESFGAVVVSACVVVVLSTVTRGSVAVDAYPEVTRGVEVTIEVWDTGGTSEVKG